MSTQTAARTSNTDNVEDVTTARRVANSAHDLIDDTAAKAENVELRLRERAAVAGDKLEATKDTANEQVEQSLARVESYVKEKPLTAAGIAFAAGVVATSILRR